MHPTVIYFYINYLLLLTELFLMTMESEYFNMDEHWFVFPLFLTSFPLCSIASAYQCLINLCTFINLEGNGVSVLVCVYLKHN